MLLNNKIADNKISDNKIENSTPTVNEFIGKEFTGKEFIDHYNKSETKFYKILKKDCVHNGYQFINGLNIDPVEFNPKGSCSPG